MRKGAIIRKTNETSIEVGLDLDGSGVADVTTGIGFFDHMLDQLARHSLIDIKIRAEGDRHIDDHHTVEDVGIALGHALAKALGEKRGLTRYADCLLPMDETLTRVALDVSGRPFLVFRTEFPTEKIGAFDTELVREFFQAFAGNAGLTLHIETLYGSNSHHIAESCFQGGCSRASRRDCDRFASSRARAVDQGSALGRHAMSVAIVDYGSGNLHSARKAFERAAREAGLSREVKVTAKPEDVLAADHVVLPGVGAFADCRRGLDGVSGMVEALDEAVRQRGRPFLGICVGAQLMATRGLEHETVAGLDWIAGDVAAIKPSDPGLKIPHMGWNTLDVRRSHALLEGVSTGETGLHAYFVHSYQLYADDSGDLVATAEYGGPVTAMIAHDNIAGTQFHPEKSQMLGLRLIANFLKWRP